MESISAIHRPDARLRCIILTLFFTLNNTAREWFLLYQVVPGQARKFSEMLPDSVAEPVVLLWPRRIAHQPDFRKFMPCMHGLELPAGPAFPVGKDRRQVN